MANGDSSSVAYLEELWAVEQDEEEPPILASSQVQAYIACLTCTSKCRASVT